MWQHSFAMTTYSNMLTVFFRSTQSAALAIKFAAMAGKQARWDFKSVQTWAMYFVAQKWLQISSGAELIWTTIFLCAIFTESSLCFAFQLRHLTLLLDVTFHVLWRHPWSNLVKTLFQQSVVLMLKPLLFCLASCHSSAWFPWQWYHDTSTGKS